MNVDIYNPYANQRVTQDYVTVIEQALQNQKHRTQTVDKLVFRPENRRRGVVVTLPLAAIQARLAGYGKIILWVQGVSSEESYMRHHSAVRRHFLRQAEKEGLRQADFILFVSRTMRTYYEKLGHTTFPNSYVMPCFNEEWSRAAFDTPGKYTKNVFVYAGSMASWQCFEETVQLYAAIEQRVPDAFFRILVKEQEAAKVLLRRYGVQHYALDFVPKEQVQREMAGAKFGFCIRRDSVVNRVATPTKLSGYIAAGVMPIYAACLEDFSRQAGSCPYCFPVSQDVHLECLLRMCTENPAPEDVYTSFQSCFGQYYSREYHREALTETMRHFL